MKIFKLKASADRRVRAGHPWVFARELQGPVKSLMAGEEIELHDSMDDFISRGYAHPTSSIAYRRMTTDPEAEPLSEIVVYNKLKKAWQVRAKAGLSQVSHRLLFAEGDEFPGLIIDRFLSEEVQIFAVQSSTAGVDHILERVLSGLERLVNEFQLQPGWAKTAVILSLNSNARKLEGLEVGGRKFLKSIEYDFNNFAFYVQHGASERMTLHADLFGGQKTGFFFDQRFNIDILLSLLSREFAASTKSVAEYKVLDLCCYVGQWAAHLGRLLKAHGVSAEATLFDTSASALEYALKNSAAYYTKINPMRGNVLEDLSQLKPNSFDLVICDPPAFIKGKKDLHKGIPAYKKLNREALKLVKTGGWFVTCSCSGALDEEKFSDLLKDAMEKAKRSVIWTARGGHAIDHPIRPEFPEGQYLKCRIGKVNS